MKMTLRKMAEEIATRIVDQLKPFRGGNYEPRKTIEIQGQELWALLHLAASDGAEAMREMVLEALENNIRQDDSSVEFIYPDDMRDDLKKLGKEE